MVDQPGAPPPPGGAEQPPPAVKPEPGKQTPLAAKPEADKPPRSTWRELGQALLFTVFGLLLLAGTFALVSHFTTPKPSGDTGLLALLSRLANPRQAENTHIRDFAFAGGVVALILGSITFVSWIFKLGRFGDGVVQPRESLLFAITDFFVKLINDFRHLLAVVVLGTFFIVTIAMLYPGYAHSNVYEMGEGLKMVAATLGSLVASVIGYYFGESAGKKNIVDEKTTQAPFTPPAQNLLATSPKEVGSPINTDTSTDAGS